jgi:hypothetical protein
MFEKCAQEILMGGRKRKKDIKEEKYILFSNSEYRHTTWFPGL